MNKTKILDKYINFNNYANFKKCKISKNHKVISFVMACNVKYEVDIDYFLKWNEYPHYINIKEQLLEWKETNEHLDIRLPLFSKCKMILSNTAVQVYLNNGYVYDIPWDTVLMACEQSYEHFGGLNERSKHIVNEWYMSKAQKDKIE